MKGELTYKGNVGMWRHGWLRLTPAYGVQLVERMVDALTPNDVVLDPFCGTGTTALVCAKRGIPADTTDINPFLIWLATAKFAHYSKRDCEQAERLPIHSSEDTHWLPPIKDIEKWWDPCILQKLANLYRQIQQARITENARNLLKASFCRLIIKCANVSFGHQSMSFKQNLAVANGEMAEFLDAEFHNILKETIDSAADNPRSASRVVLADSRRLDTVLEHDRYTCVLTSPPYPNRMSYIRELRPYMYWLGFLENARQASDLDWQAIGGTWGTATSNLTKWNPDVDVPHAGFMETIEQIRRGNSPILAPYVHKYFVDAVHHVRSLKQVMRRGARAHYVVGNSKFYNTMLHTEEIYASIFRSEGFTQVGIENIRKRSSKKELFEFVVSAKKR
jgi:hypothetical protein